ncbi:SMP-30/gluconolactonase/LRE family protein [Sinomonas flava]|uniref:SMP-30/gluconolactonase/LRE family protein n=1 Tax=Sinomonas flava TaxID=496857 RepID=UPI0039A75243
MDFPNFPPRPQSPAVASALGRPLARRTVLGAAVAGAAVALAGAPHAAADPGRTVPAPETVALPAGFQPEGITSGPGTRFYVGSLADGRILTGDLLTGETSTLWAGSPGRSLRGLRFDPRTGYLWAVGNDAEGSKVWALDGGSGQVAAVTPVADTAFLNDLDFADDGVWVTDSFGDQLALVRLTPNGEPASVPAERLALGGDWPGGSGFRANGVRTLPDGSLVLNNSSAGGLWRVPLPSGEVQPIPVSGGPGIVSGDGLELRGSTLYNVRGTGGNEVAVLRLNRPRGAWSATWVGDRTDATLDVPSTATLAGGWLWAVNARFGVTSPETAAYWITQLPAR